MFRLLHSVVALAAAGMALSCRPSPTPCASAGTCPEGEECLANRCVPVGGEPVPEAAARLVLEPTQLAVVDRHTTRGASLPTAVTFGSQRGGRTVLYLRFAPLGLQGSLQSAFLLLQPAQGANRGAEDVSVTAWRIAQDWSEQGVSFLDPLSLEPPHARGIARPQPPSVLRIDVTELVRVLVDQPGADRGIALRASGGDDAGVSFATGAGVGLGPRLEVYFAPTKAKASRSARTDGLMPQPGSL